jgi:hypothetical protein
VLGVAGGGDYLAVDLHGDPAAVVAQVLEQLGHC